MLNPQLLLDVAAGHSRLPRLPVNILAYLRYWFWYRSSLSLTLCIYQRLKTQFSSCWSCTTGTVLVSVELFLISTILNKRIQFLCSDQLGHTRKDCHDWYVSEVGGAFSLGNISFWNLLVIATTTVQKHGNAKWFGFNPKVVGLTLKLSPFCALDGL